MGIVFEARHRQLDLRVAIKVLRPELATAIAAERFVAEGRILARLPHPNIVRIYDARDEFGLLFCVMEFVEGESLADRLKRGPLSPAEAIRLSQDLLGALEAAHAEGVIHRDVKPANILLRKGKALLGDFGIARRPQEGGSELTTPGQLIGTLPYMSPEARDGVTATERTDVYSAGLVLWEACTGERWPAYGAPEAADWRGIPAELRPALRRALALTPEARWPDAREMALALKQPATRLRWPFLAAAGALTALLGWLILPSAGLSPAPPPPRGAVTIAVERFRMESPELTQTFGDSVAAVFRRALEYPDFYVLAAGSSDDTAAVRVIGSVRLEDGQIRMIARADGSKVRVEFAGASADWEAVVDTLSRRLVKALWEPQANADHWLPVKALPSTDEGFDHFFRGEQLLAQARWEEAWVEFRGARADTSCYLCTFRLLDIERWLGLPHDPADIGRLRSGIDRFPPHYQSLIRAALTDLPGRIDTLAVAAAGDFFLASFEYGDELFHRGPLYGYPRIDAKAPLERAVLVRPRFGPGWEHLTWLLLSEGDSIAAGAALDSLLRLPPGPARGFSAAMRVFLRLGYNWRFLSADSARVFSRLVLADPFIAASENAAAGGRLMMTADAPRGAVELGGLITRAWRGRDDAVREGLLAQLFGYAALGRLDSMRATGLRLGEKFPDRSLPLLALEMEATLRAFDPDSTLRRAPDLLEALDVYSSARATQPILAMRAVLASGLLALRSGDSARAGAAGEALARGPEFFSGVLRAAMLASQDDAQGARAALPRLPPLEGPGKHEAPLLDAMVRLLRAEQFERLGEFDSARETLLWYEHLQTVGHGTGDPAPGEMAWALGTHARWRLAKLPGATPREQCSAYRAVARHWSDGVAPFKSRADSAKTFVEQHCPQ